MHKDEKPKKKRRIKDIMKHLSTNQEGARTVTHAIAHNLYESKDNCEKVKCWYKYFNESGQKQRYYNYPLSFKHKGSSAVFLEELPRNKSYNYLKEVKIDIYCENLMLTFTNPSLECLSTTKRSQCCSA